MPSLPLALGGFDRRRGDLMEPTKSSQAPPWSVLFLGAPAGLIVLVALNLLSVYLTAPGESVTSILVGLILVSTFTVPGLVAGLVSHLALAKVSWAPRLTWLLLALLYSISQALTILVVNILPALLPPSWRSVVSTAAVPLLALATFGFWLLIAHAALAAMLNRSGRTVETAGRQLWFIAGQAALAVFVAASWLPGIGTLIMGGGVGVAAMTALAVYGTGRRSPENRSPAFLIALWLLPALTLVCAITVIVLDI